MGEDGRSLIDNDKILRRITELETRMQRASFGDQEQSAFGLSLEQKRNYKRNTWKAWALTLLGIVMSFFISDMALSFFGLLESSIYDRSGVDSLTLKYLKEYDWDDIIVDDLFIASFDYNSKTPRFYSKYFKK